MCERARERPKAEAEVNNARHARGEGEGRGRGIYVSRARAHRADRAGGVVWRRGKITPKETCMSFFQLKECPVSTDNVGFSGSVELPCTVQRRK